MRETREEAVLVLEERDFTWNNGSPMRTLGKDGN